MSQPNTSAQRVQDCRHAKTPFDALFSMIGERPDIGPGAKLLYGKLVTMHRTGNVWTQEQLGAALGTCRQNIWRWTRELVAADLLLVTRLGQGRPNAYVLLGVPQEDLDGNAPRFKAPGSGHQDGRRPDAPRATLIKERRTTKKPGDYGSKDYTMTRWGRLPDPCARCYSRLHTTPMH